jgi:ABC-type Zn uptake system ZnuABC Zn-binding protein ZnuA
MSPANRALFQSQRQRLGLFAGALILVVATIGLLPGPLRGLAQPSGLKVVATTTVLADLVRQVGAGRLAAVSSVVPAGVDVEDYNPAPADLRTVAEANLMVTNGLALDRWAPKLVEAANPRLPILVLSNGLPVLGLNESDDADIADNGNPHLWLDVQYARIYVQKIHAQLDASDPDGAAIYAANTARYLAQLDELDAWIQEQVATLPVERRKLVTFHDAYPYFAARYGFELVGVITPSPGQEPSAGELAELVTKVKAAQVPAVFSEIQFSPRLIETLANEAGVTRVVSDLYNDSLGDPPIDTYIAMMRYNVERIVQALA